MISTHTTLGVSPHPPREREREIITNVYVGVNMYLYIYVEREGVREEIAFGWGH